MGTDIADRYSEWLKFNNIDNNKNIADRYNDNAYTMMNMISIMIFDWFILPIANPDGYRYSRQVQ